MMDNIETTQEILNVIADNTESVDEALFIVGLVVTKIYLANNIEKPDFDDRVARLIAMVREDERKDLQ